MSVITDYLKEIASEATRFGIDVDRDMNPGADRELLSRTASKLPYAVPESVLEIFQWKNGVKLEEQDREVRIFPRLLFRTFEDSVVVTNICLNQLKTENIFWNESWLSLCTDNAGEYYALNVAEGDNEYGRVYLVLSEDPPVPAFYSLETMLRSILECYRARLYFLDEHGYLDEDDEKTDKVYKKFNSGLSPIWWLKYY